MSPRVCSQLTALGLVRSLLTGSGAAFSLISHNDPERHWQLCYSLRLLFKQVYVFRLQGCPKRIYQYINCFELSGVFSNKKLCLEWIYAERSNSSEKVCRSCYYHTLFWKCHCPSRILHTHLNFSFWCSWMFVAALYWIITPWIHVGLHCLLRLAAAL